MKHNYLLQKLIGGIEEMQRAVLLLAGFEIMLLLGLGIFSTNVHDIINSNVWIIGVIALAASYFLLQILRMVLNKFFHTTAGSRVKSIKRHKSVSNGMELLSDS